MVASGVIPSGEMPSDDVRVPEVRGEASVPIACLTGHQVFTLIF
jgi:hypothetical protein